jgi:hypothetical protein
MAILNGGKGVLSILTHHTVKTYQLMKYSYWTEPHKRKGRKYQDINYGRWSFCSPLLDSTADRSLLMHYYWCDRVDYREDLAVYSREYEYITALHAISSHKHISHFVLKDVAHYIRSCCARSNWSVLCKILGVSSLTSRLFRLGLSSVWRGRCIILKLLAEFDLPRKWRSLQTVRPMLLIKKKKHKKRIVSSHIFWLSACAVWGITVTGIKKWAVVGGGYFLEPPVAGRVMEI